MLIHTTIIVLLVINLIIGIMNMTGNNVKAVINDIEATKVWGQKNYIKLQKIMESDAYKSNYAENLDAMILQMDNPPQELSEPITQSDQAETIDIPAPSNSSTWDSASELVWDQ